MPKKCILFQNSKKEKFSVPDIVWNSIKSDLPKLKRGMHSKGRPQISNRVAFGAVLYIIWSGDNWASLKDMALGCSGTVAYNRYRVWKKAGIFSKLAKLNIDYNEPEGVRWAWMNEIENLTKNRGLERYRDNDELPPPKEKDISAYFESIPYNELQETMKQLIRIPSFNRFYRDEFNSWTIAEASNILMRDKTSVNKRASA